MSKDYTQDAKQLNTLLESRPLARLMEAAKRHRCLSELLHCVLPSEVIAHLTSFSLDGDTILLYAKNSAWATRLRGSTNDLIYAAERYRALGRIRHCKILVRPKKRPDNHPKRAQRPRRPNPTQGSIAVIQSLANDCEHDELKTALRQLSNTLANINR